MADYRVDCITPDDADADRRINALGGVKPDGGRWYDTIDAVIACIDAGHTFWTLVGLYRADVYVRTHPTTFRRYLTTSADGYGPNNLLSLPTCA